MSTKEKIAALDDELTQVYDFVKKNTPKGGVNATQVGIVIGRKTSSNASSWGNYRLKKLLDEDLIQKDEDTKKYTVKGAKAEGPKPSKKAKESGSDKDAKSKGPEGATGNTEDDLVAGRTIVEFEPHVLSKESKKGMKTVRGIVTKVFFEDDGRRFAQVKMDHNGKRCYKRDRFLTVLGETPADEEE